MYGSSENVKGGSVLKVGITGKTALKYFLTWAHGLERIPLPPYAALFCFQIFRGAQWLGTFWK